MTLPASATAGPILKPVDQPKSLKQAAYEALHRAILAGELRQGEIYKEKELATRLSISRTPVREALLELSTKELVTFLPRKGVMITQFDQEDWNEIFELRRALEVAIVEKVAPLATSRDIDRMEALLQEQQACAERQDGLAFLHYDRLFHSLLGDLTRNSRMISSYSNIQDLIQLMGTYSLTAEGRMQGALDEHREIVQALTQGDAEAACQRMIHHLEVTRDMALGRCALSGLEAKG
jgi:DNA-binding GntR family transcriptional regulator